jgi:hypothetical protein
VIIQLKKENRNVDLGKLEQDQTREGHVWLWGWGAKVSIRVMFNIQDTSSLVKILLLLIVIITFLENGCSILQF